ncbi:MAG: crossover junction endodeoxyribonuclease RuvC [Minisyncoccota bacterium]
MKVLAIDPGYGRCGVAVVERQGNADVLLYSDCIETSPTTEFTERLNTVAAECRRLIRSHTPDCLAMEKLYFAKSRTTGLRVAEVRGAILSIAGEASLAVFEYSPSEVKAAAAGFGGADKKQVIKMLHALVKIEKPVRLDDEYDAIAVGVTHLAMHKMLAARALHSKAN